MIEAFELPTSGVFYLRVEGDQRNAAQLYELRAELLERVPGPRLRLANRRVTEESGIVKNERIDPDESVRLVLDVVNEGDLPATQLGTTVMVSANAVLFSENFPTSISVGQVGEIELIVGATGVCGDEILIAVTMTGDSGELLSEVMTFEVGSVSEPIAIDESFSESGGLLRGWTSEVSGSGQDWGHVSSRSQSPLRSAFSAATDSVGEAYLVSPTFQLAAGGGTLTFSHLYRIEAGFDGGVLEVSRDGGEWSDLVTDPAVQISGGYNRTIRDGFGSALAGQQAWSGVLTNFTDVMIALPSAWAGEDLQFRWRLVHDTSSAREGWWIDDVKVEMLVEDCEVHRPEFSLSFESGRLDENYPSDPAILKLAPLLPLVAPVTVPLSTSGSAAVGGDVSANLMVTVPAGEAFVEVPIQVIVDEQEEGDEDLRVEIPNDREGFAAGTPAAVELVVRDLVDFAAWEQEFFAEIVNPSGDSDGDGFAEIAEYVLGTDPTDRDDFPPLTLGKVGERFLIPLGSLPERSDASLGIEFSDDLQSWTSMSFLKTSEGLEVTPLGGAGYFRLTFSLAR